MAWKTGSHHEAPQGVLVYPTAKPNEVTWFEEDAPQPEPAAETQGGAAHGGRRHRDEEKP